MGLHAAQILICVLDVFRTNFSPVTGYRLFVYP